MKTRQIIVLAALVLALISGYVPAQGDDTSTNSWPLTAQRSGKKRPPKNDQRSPQDEGHSPRNEGRQPQNNQRQPKNDQGRSTRMTEPIQRQIGLIQNTSQAFDGYTLFAPKHDTITYLMDNDGNIVHSWRSGYEPGQSVYLLENGNLLHASFIGPRGSKTFGGGGDGGRVELFDWDGNLIWELNYSTDQYFSHHDVEPLPNGNILLIVWEYRSQAQALAAGRDPNLLADGKLWPDSVVEIKPTGTNGADVVWEWHVWDHLIQDYDASKANYGDVGAHPELIDINVWVETGSPARANWNHMNSIDYNPELDQIMLSVRGFSELWVIDHSTTTAEASAHSGGRSGKGGDLLYRWGNPAAYRAGTTTDQMLFQQHDAQWIEPGLPGAGNILIYNNGIERSYSTVDEIIPPVDGNGNYTLETGKAFEPKATYWLYKAPNPTDFFSGEISGAHRLPNGNTLICEGIHGHFFEVTPDGKIVWEYVNPNAGDGPLRQGEPIAIDVRGHPMNAVFKIHRYAADYVGLVGKDLTSQGKLVQ